MREQDPAGGQGQGQDHLGLGCCSKDFGFQLGGRETIRGPADEGYDLIRV